MGEIWQIGQISRLLLSMGCRFQRICGRRAMYESYLRSQSFSNLQLSVIRLQPVSRAITIIFYVARKQV
jgi:hypothetical protein